MVYTAQDEQFIHQLPRTFDHVFDSDESFSDRCYFNVHAPDSTWLLTTGYGNNPNGQYAHGYAKFAHADGRHFDLDARRTVIDDRRDNYAGPMRWTCIEPLKRWKLELGPNPSGFEYELDYESMAPLWELLPISLRKNGRVLADMTHIKQPAHYTGWVSIDGERTEVTGFAGGRDRTIGVRVSDQIDFWVWFEAVFEDRAIEAWVWEAADGTVLYVDGGITFANGTQSKRFVSFSHDITFEEGRKRPLHADITFVDTDGVSYAVKADANHREVGIYHGPSSSKGKRDGAFSWDIWDSKDAADIAEVEPRTVSIDQLMTFEMDGMSGQGIFELLAMGDHYPRYPTW